jgi:biopolymer transport protein ExbD
MITPNVMEVRHGSGCAESEDGARERGGIARNQHHALRRALSQREECEHQRSGRRDPEPLPNPKSVYVRADKATIWDPIAQVISELGAAKIDVKVVTQPEDEADKKLR